MSKNQQIIERIVVTFFQAVIAYLTVNQTNLHGNWRIVAIGALGAGLSAVYNVLRQSNPTIPTYPKSPVAAGTTIQPDSPTDQKEKEILDDLANEETPPVTPPTT